MTKPLVIVESPAKARNIARFLGSGYVVESSVGHIRDLPANASEVPPEHKGKPWAAMGVDVDNDFTPVYVVSKDKKTQVSTLRRLVKDASEVYLATDEDREGEAIAWHLREVLSPRVPVRRMVFHEITPQAIQAAIANPRDLDERLVDAQEARRIVDRLYGYEVSPVLWKKVNPGLSAGRVQSVATRMVVERERERMAFVAATWWGVQAVLRPSAPVEGDLAETLTAMLVAVDGSRVATGRDFANDGTLSRSGVTVLDEAAARSLATNLQTADFTVSSVDTKPYRRRPAPPFQTSSLQQEAGRKLRLSTARTMQVAQRLYENGYITYMRTDSVNLSETALRAARADIAQRFGRDYLPEQPRRYTTKVKNAQEAHEAIRPAGDSFRAPDQLRSELNRDELALYELIWKRTLASQMTDALGTTVAIRFAAPAGGRTAELAASGTTISHPGFLRAYVEGSDDPEAELDDREVVLPRVAQGDHLTADSVVPEGHDTQPSARYTEAALVKHLEELGIGRPSTYASIISTIIGRGYVWKKGAALVPSFTAFAVVTLLENHFGDLVDYAFTARMEDELDDVANGEAEALPYLRRFYFGDDGDGGLKAKVSHHLDRIDAAAINSIPLGVDAEGTPVVARVGRYGPYVQRGEQSASLADDLAPDELTLDRAIELLEAGSDDRVLGTDPATGVEVVARNGRYGPYVQLGRPEDGKPQKTSSLLPSMSLDSITLEDGLRLLTLPRLLGVHPADGEEITAQNGRYGPYVKHGKESRSLESVEDLFTVSLADALALLSQPKRGGRQATSIALRELGTDPASGKELSIRDGRFGAYVTDGEVNASLRKGDTVEGLTIDRANELLAMRRERLASEPPKKTTARRGRAKS